jgi:hypothetical protein
VSQARRILLALTTGADTSEEIAALLDGRRSVISVALCRLADTGLVERAGVVNEGRAGQPYVRWRLRRAGLPCPSAFGSGRAPGKTMNHVHADSAASRQDHRRRPTR